MGKKSWKDSYYGGKKGKGKGKGKNKNKGNKKQTVPKKVTKKRDSKLAKRTILPEVSEVQQACNHAKAKDYFTVEEFRNYVSTKYDAGVQAVMMGDVQKVVDYVGDEDVVRVCNVCYEPIVEAEALADAGLDPETIAVAIRLITALAVHKEKDKKVKLFNEDSQKIIKNLKPLKKVYNKKIAKHSKDDDDEAGVGTSTNSYASQRG